MYVSPQERPFETLASGLGGFGTGFEDEFGGGDRLAFAPGDAVSRMLPPFMGSPASALGGLASPLGMGNPMLDGLFPLLQQLGGLLQQLSQRLGCSGNGSNGSCGTSPQQYFSNANGSSTGDPHLAFSGNGSNAHWDSMTGHADLLDSNSFEGGYRLSTQTTTPNANGVTFNRSASVATRNGGTNVMLDNQGNATIDRYGQSFALQAGQSYDLGEGERVARGADGAVDITEQNEQGGTIETTLRDNGPGVDVNVQANNVGLGGDLANAGGQTDPPVRIPLPHIGEPRRYHPPHPIFGPASAEFED